MGCKVVSSHQRLNNAKYRIYPLFQKRWAGDLTAYQAYEKALIEVRNELVSQIDDLEQLTFQEFCRTHCYNVDAEDMRK